MMMQLHGIRLLFLFLAIGSCAMEEKKTPQDLGRGSTSEFVRSVFYPTIVPTPELATDIARSVIKAHFDVEFLIKNEPLITTDLDDRWDIRGTGACVDEPLSCVRVTIRKTDGAIVWLGVDATI